MHFNIVAFWYGLTAIGSIIAIFALMVVVVLHRWLPLRLLALLAVVVLVAVLCGLSF